MKQLLIPVALLTATTCLGQAGSLDLSFGGTGMVSTALTTYDNGAAAVAIQPDQKIVTGGYANTGGRHDFCLARYKPNGTLDSTFNGTGIVTFSVSSLDDGIEDIAIQPDGKIVAVGWADNNNHQDIALARFNPDGSIDNTFGTGGKVTTDMAAGNESAFGVVIQPDGKIVVCGTAWPASSPTDPDMVVVRYTAAGAPDNRPAPRPARWSAGRCPRRASPRPR